MSLLLYSNNFPSKLSSEKSVARIQKGGKKVSNKGAFTITRKMEKLHFFLQIFCLLSFEVPVSERHGVICPNMYLPNGIVANHPYFVRRDSPYFYAKFPIVLIFLDFVPISLNSLSPKQCYFVSKFGDFDHFNHLA